MDIIIYQEDDGKVSILERENKWWPLKKYVKGKFPHNLYIYLSICIIICSLFFVEPVGSTAILFGLSFIYFVIVEIFENKRFIVSDESKRMKILKSDIILSYGEIYPDLYCFIVIKDKSNVLVFSSSFSIKSGLYISNETEFFDNLVYKNLYTNEYFGNTFVNDIKTIIGNIKNNGDFYEYGRLKNCYLLDFVYIYNKYVKNI